ncbi:hypothetical protein RchiOBHm_Chr2g0171921 [Rosa chinensis]|uniref:Uncharacterized protein n=1 Tax=Rosa chinensis TaxID=74649 RepID=A0A2P6S5H4_ROSCH|nr:hypothetical protein RchiOBHm_Chr2g0171921 [Rosa chinensis]
MIGSILNYKCSSPLGLRVALFLCSTNRVHKEFKNDQESERQGKNDRERRPISIRSVSISAKMRSLWLCFQRNKYLNCDGGSSSSKRLREGEEDRL